MDKQILVDAIKLRLFQEAYIKLHPNHDQPTDNLLKRLFDYPDIEVFCSKLNLIIVLKLRTHNVFLKHWCLASEKLPSSVNIKAFMEVKRYVRTFEHPCISDSLTPTFFKSSEPYPYGRFRKMK